VISAKLFAKQIEKLAVDNAPVILTAIGVTGTLATAILTARASFAAADLLAEEDERRFRMNESQDITKTQAVKLVWKGYIPAVGVGITTIACVICANRISTRRIAAMAAAYSLSEKAYSEYREKVVEKFNANKERQVRDDIAQDRVNANPPKDSQIIITGNGDVVCYDLPTGRYFKSNMEKLRSVVNDVNAQVNEVGFAPLSDFYVSLGLKDTPYSEEIGWTTEELLDVHYSAVLTEENTPCIAINYRCKPIRQGTGAGFPQGCDDPPF
jgi:hypothetical protein